MDSRHRRTHGDTLLVVAPHLAAGILEPLRADLGPLFSLHIEFSFFRLLNFRLYYYLHLCRHPRRRRHLPPVGAVALVVRFITLTGEPESLHCPHRRCGPSSPGTPY